MNRDEDWQAPRGHWVWIPTTPRWRKCSGGRERLTLGVREVDEEDEGLPRPKGRGRNGTLND